MTPKPTVLGVITARAGSKGIPGKNTKRLAGKPLIAYTIESARASGVFDRLILSTDDEEAARIAFESVDTDLENAGRTLGYGEWTLFTRITFPLAWRGIAAGSMLAFARAMGEFGATLMVAGNIPGRTQTLSIAIYEAVHAGDDALANGLVVVASVVCIALLVAASFVVRRGHLKVEPL